MPEDTNTKAEIDLWRYHLVDLDRLTTPEDGDRVICDAYWAIYDGKALFYRVRGALTPQCNKQKSIVSRFAPDGCEVVHIPAAFVKDEERFL